MAGFIAAMPAAPAGGLFQPGFFGATFLAGATFFATAGLAIAGFFATAPEAVVFVLCGRALP